MSAAHRATADGPGAIRPPLKWAGGKRWLVPHLRPLWEPYRDRLLVEPLCGGLAVTLGLVPARASLNDINAHLVSFYRWLKCGLEIEIPMANDATLYYAHRERFNELVRAGQADSREAAELFYYLNRTGYNGLCRFNKRGAFNVPFGRYTAIRYVRDFTPYREVFRNWRFTAGAFDATPLEPGAFVYADPPYDVEFTQYSSERFGWAEQERLAEWLCHHDGPVALSNQATDRVIDLYRRLGFAVHFLEAPRMISSSGDRTPAREVLALRNLEWRPLDA